ncbi:hypothetical protein ACIQGZ_19810 [Streptomyces sp. NPDC092296]|uniref:hypothetical protein n=1 Tax=Streptomyces sp. NPDC092296 TaxID=3366012 RepID=UPI00380662CA
MGGCTAAQAGGLGRFGNGVLGWNHFSRSHDISDPEVRLRVRKNDRPQDGTYKVTGGNGMVGVITAHRIGKNKYPDAPNR